MTDCIFITGGAGFIGSSLVRLMISETEFTVVNIDCLTYAGNPQSLADVADHPRYRFEQVDIRNSVAIMELFDRYKPVALYHLAAESHVDRSIDHADEFLSTNITGTFVLLEAVRQYLAEFSLPDFRMLHASTDEVFGSLGSEGFFTEDSAYDPNSPYAASKASADHLVRAWRTTHDLPVLITNCSNNYGPYQFPEKLIPLVIQKILSGQPIPIYGDGSNVRDWLFVEDHCRALKLVLEKGRLGETYVIGGRAEKSNLQIVKLLCSILEEIRPADKTDHYEGLITFVKDRPGHDHRYAIDCTKIEAELGWTPGHSFEDGLKETVEWYVENQSWSNNVLDGSYQGERLGVSR